MLKKFARRIGLNFKHTRSERVATNSYRNYHQKIRRAFQKVNIFRKINKGVENKYDKS